MAAPINNCVLIIHMILSAFQLYVHTCVVDVPYQLIRNTANERCRSRNLNFDKNYTADNPELIFAVSIQIIDDNELNLIS